MQNLYSMFDDKTDSYTSPYTAPNDMAAQRMFAHALGSNPIMASNPTDFSLIRLGTFDDSSGEIVNEQEIICCGPDVLNMNKVAE